MSEKLIKVGNRKGELTFDDDWHRFTVPVCLPSLLHLLDLSWVVDKVSVEGGGVVLSAELVPATCEQVYQ